MGKKLNVKFLDKKFIHKDYFSSGHWFAKLLLVILRFLDKEKINVLFVWVNAPIFTRAYTSIVYLKKKRKDITVIQKYQIAG